MHDPLDALFRALEDDPGDVVSLCALADWFEETDRPGPARAVRWAVSRGLRPHPRGGVYIWASGDASMRPTWPAPCRLPPALWRALRHGPSPLTPGNVKGYPTRRLAWEALIDAFPLRLPGEAA